MIHVPLMGQSLTIKSTQLFKVKLAVIGFHLGLAQAAIESNPHSFMSKGLYRNVILKVEVFSQTMGSV